jgi:hypothetical protein
MRPGVDIPPLPTRVIDIGNKEIDPFLVHSNGRAALYCALSYCWGSADVLKTTKTSISIHEKCIPMKNAPKTIHDAIEITRKLGFRYIWIDALCILQDDQADWLTESPKMVDIYSNATLTIAAVDSDCAEGGIFRNRRNSVITPVPLKYWEDGSPSVGNGVDKATMHLLPHDNTVRDKGPLNTRAWALQEEILSPRLLFYGNGLLHWECCSISCTETDPGDKPIAYINSSTTSSLDYNRSREIRRVFFQENRETSAEELFSIWEEVVASFTVRNLTYKRDKISAILGLAKRMELMLRQKFVAGVWDGKFVLPSLAWELKIPGSKDDNWPSWSWASANSEVNYSFLSAKARQLYGISPPVITTGSLQIIEIKDAPGKLARHSAPLLKAQATIRKGSERFLQGYRKLDSGWCGNGPRQYLDKPGRVAWDLKSGAPSEWWFLVLTKIGSIKHEQFNKRYESWNKAASIVCLCVKPVTAFCDGIFERVGICEVEDCDEFWTGASYDHVISLV